MLFMAGIAMLGDISLAAWPGKTACDVDEVLWPDRNRREDAA